MVTSKFCFMRSMSTGTADLAGAVWIEPVDAACGEAFGITWDAELDID
jgi:hypothetical protein